MGQADISAVDQVIVDEEDRGQLALRLVTARHVVEEGLVACAGDVDIGQRVNRRGQAHTLTADVPQAVPGLAGGGAGMDVARAATSRDEVL